MNDINDVRKRLRADLARKDSPIEYSAHDRDVLALLDATEWRDIESAPKDGTWIWAGWLRQPPTMILHWNDSFAQWVDDNGTDPLPPTHWMPLPPNPHD